MSDGMGKDRMSSQEQYPPYDRLGRCQACGKSGAKCHAALLSAEEMSVLEAFGRTGTLQMSEEEETFLCKGCLRVLRRVGLGSGVRGLRSEARGASAS